ncbi:MAG: hypothetical protein HRT35_34835, partial [Algicola sp.]|nr:hypothetical protein [Algicola sp.]
EGANAQQMVCYGRVDFCAASGQTKPSVVDGVDASDTKLCLAKTGSEAIAAYLSKLMGSTEQEATRIENQLQAALFAEELQGDNIDFVNKLKLARHQAGFTPISSGKVWTFTDYTSLVLAGQLDDDQTKAFKGAYQLFQQDMNPVLDKLNHLQDQLNQGDIELQNLRSLLYADWSKYMLCLYPAIKDGEMLFDADMVRHLMQQSTMKSLKQQQLYVAQLAPQIAQVKAALDKVFNACCETAHVAKAAIARSHLLEVPGDRYWRANEPSLLIAGDVAEPSQRHGCDGQLTCQLITTSEASISDWLVAGNTGINWVEHAINQWQNQPWNPLCVEWMMDLHSDSGIEHSVNANQKDYAPEHIVSSYRISLNDNEFSLPGASVDLRLKANQPLTTEENPNVVVGRSLLTHSVKSLMADKLQGTIDDHAELSAGQAGHDDPRSPMKTVSNALQRLKSTPCLTQQLEGFHDELMMNSSLHALRVVDPIGFDPTGQSKDSFTSEVNALLDNGFFKLPSLGHQFTPIKSGVTRLGKVRIVDSFGRFKDLDCNETLRPQREMIGSAVFSPPRVLQPLRLQFRWTEHLERAATANTKSNTPICGWVCYNLFDESLVCYDTAANVLGQINSDGEWTSQQGQLQSLDGVTNASFKTFILKLLSFHNRNRLVKSRFVDQPNGTDALWQQMTELGIIKSDSSNEKAALLPIDPSHWPPALGISFAGAEVLFTKARGETNYWPQLKQVIRRGQDNIEPAVSQDMAGVLSMKPLAVVQASLSLELYGQAQVNKSWSALAQDINNGQRSNRGFTDVQFPIKLGEYRNLEDSLIGYWMQDDAGELSQTGFFPQSDGDDLDGWIDAASFDPQDHDYVDAVSGEGVVNLQQSLSDPASNLLMLMDPEGSVHATCGIIPKTTLSQDHSLYVETLKKLQLGYFAAPLLTPRDRLSLPLNTQHPWYWQTRGPTGELSHIPSVPVCYKTPFISAGGLASDWLKLIELDVLKPLEGKPDEAFYS